MIGKEFKVTLPWGEDEAEYTLEITDYDKGSSGSYWDPPDPGYILFDLTDPTGIKEHPNDLMRRAEELAWEIVEREQAAAWADRPGRDE